MYVSESLSTWGREDPHEDAKRYVDRHSLIYVLKWIETHSHRWDPLEDAKTYESEFLYT